MTNFCNNIHTSFYWFYIRDCDNIFLIAGDILSYISSYYTQTILGISNYIWSKLVYRKVNLTAKGSLLECKSLCYSDPESKCLLLAYEPPLCYLGDPGNNGTITTTDNTLTLLSIYGNVHKVQSIFLVLNSANNYVRLKHAIL